jgi:signal transduction histidine kinase
MVNESSQLGYALQMFIDAYIAMDKYDSAKFYLDEVKHLNNKYPNEYLETVNLSQAAELFLHEKKYDSATYACNKVIEFYGDLQMDDAVLHTRLLLSRMHLELNDLNKALELAEKVYTVSDRIRNQVMIVKSSNALSNIHTAKGNFGKSLEYANIALMYKDSLMLRSLNGSIEGRMIDVQLEKETAAKLSVINALEKQNVLIGRQTLIIIIIGAGLLGMLFIMLSIRRAGLFRKKLNLQLYEKNERLSEMNDEINGLVHTIVHDLKSPLNSVQGLLTVMELSGDNKEERQQMIGLAKRSVSNGHDIIRQLLELREVEENDTTLKVSGINVCDLLEDVRRTFQPAAANKQIDLVVDCEQFTVRTDKVQLQRVLDNLVSNAVKFSHEGSSVKVTATRDGGQSVFRVSDEGPGFSAEDLTKIYRKFQKLSARPTAGESSNGLGLATVNLLVKRLGGTIDLSTAPGKGAVFTVVI